MRRGRPLPIITIILTLHLTSACGAKMPSMFPSGAKSKGVPSEAVVKEGALEPILTENGEATGVQAPNNSIKKVFSATHLRPAEETFPVESSTKSQTVTLRYDDAGSPLLSYTLTGVSGTYTEIVDAYSDLFAATLQGVSLAKDVFKLKDTDFFAGDTIIVRFRDETSFKKTFTLQTAPVGAVRFKSSAKKCAEKNSLSVSNLSVTVTCAFGAKATHTIMYDKKDPNFQDFTLSEVLTPEDGEWRVYVSGVEIKDYTRKGTTITVIKPLEDDMTVVLVFMPKT